MECETGTEAQGASTLCMGEIGVPFHKSSSSMQPAHESTMREMSCLATKIGDSMLSTMQGSPLLPKISLGALVQTG